MPILSAKFLRIQSRCSFDSHSDCASSRRSSCLRSSNRSVRKSFPSQVNRSNAKKHGGFPRWNIRFLNCGLPRLSREQISPSMGSGSVGRLRPSVFMAPDCQWDRALVGTPEILVQMVMIGGSEEFLCRQFSKARADCCKSLEALPVPLYLHFTCTVALVQGYVQASTWREYFISSF